MIIKKARKDGKWVEVYIDEDAENPREYFDGGGSKMCCWHRRYNLGDKHDYTDPQDLLNDLNVEYGNNVVILPLYLLDHSGLRISTGSFGCPWDSGQVGYIYRVIDPAVEKVEEVIKQLNKEVEIYDQYLRGEVYGYACGHYKTCPHCGHEEDDEIVDSCTGFYSMEEIEEQIHNDFLKLLQEAEEC